MNSILDEYERLHDTSASASSLLAQTSSDQEEVSDVEGDEMPALMDAPSLRDDYNSSN